MIGILMNADQNCRGLNVESRNQQLNDKVKK